MVSVGEDDFRAEFFESFVAQAFDSGLRPNRHEKWGFNGAVRGRQTTATRISIGLRNFEVESHFSSLSGENPHKPREEQENREPNGKDYSKRFPERNLFRIGGRKTYCEQNDTPDSEYIEPRKRHDLPPRNS